MGLVRLKLKIKLEGEDYVLGDAMIGAIGFIEDTKLTSRIEQMTKLMD